MNDNTSAFNAIDYNNKIKMTIPYYEDFFKQVLDIVKNLFDKSLKWLDVGCGTGKMAEVVLDNVNIDRFVFCDNSIQMIKIAQKRFQNRNTEFITSSVQNLEENNQFDVITAIQVFHYFHKEERLVAIKKCFRALCSNGVFITFENFAPNSNLGKTLYLKRWKSYQISQGKSVEECDRHISRYGKSYFPITISEHLDMLYQCGFSSVEIIWVSNMQVGLLGIK